MHKIALALLLASPLYASAAVTNLVSNGSFENNAQANSTWNIYSNLDAWTGGVAGIELRNNVAGTAFDGKNFVELDTTRNSSMSQSITTDASQRYTISFAYSPRPGVSQESNGIEVLWNGQTMNMYSGLGKSVNVWNTYSFDVAGAAGASVLSFRAIGTSDSLGGSLDAISVVRAVPEPGTYAMLLVGLTGLGLMARRRRA